MSARSRLFQQGLVAVLGKDRHLLPLPNVPDPADPLPTALRARPDVLLLDMNGCCPVLERLPWWRQEGLRCPLVLLVGRDTTSVALRAAANAQRVGKVSAVAHSDAPAHDLVLAVRNAADGCPMLDPTVAVAVLSTVDCPLTEQELVVLRLLSEGMASSEIARKISLTQGTVRNYMSRMKNKLQGRTVVDTLRIAREHGWL